MNQTAKSELLNVLQSSESLIDKIKKRQTPEIVIGLCGTIGSGTTKVATLIQNKLTSCRFETQVIHASDIIRDLARIDQQKKDFSYIEKLQNEGNNIRQKFGNDYIAQCIIKKICETRWSKVKNLPHEEQYKQVREPSRRATIIDSLKHPDEASLFQMTYGDMFYLFGVLCPRHIRAQRLESKDLTRSEAFRCIERDESENFEYGQQLLKTIDKCDFFIRNTEGDTGRIQASVERCVELILGDNKQTPTKHEYAMFVAQASALRSGCLSRQVGACIIDDAGNIIATGRNDVPAFKGGLCTEDNNNDNRCFARHETTCSSNKQQGKILADITSILSEHIQHEAIQEVIKKIQKKTRVGGLIEFSRAIHAEMDAITTVAREGLTSLKNTTLYCTTYPCHNCARHIVASGIKTVYYIEPYEKSLATELHDDSIDKDPEYSKIGITKLQILPFDGVAPKKYMQLFKSNNRKNPKDGSLNAIDTKYSLPVIQRYVDTHIEIESKVTEHITQQTTLENPNQAG
jgi:deoxycytidylate deaminase